MKKLAVNISRLLLAAVFIVSGFVKAVDPMGTQYKLEDYAAVLGLSALLPSLAAVVLSVALAAVEFCLGVYMLFAIRRRLTSRLMLLMLCVLTPLTLWLSLTSVSPPRFSISLMRSILVRMKSVYELTRMPRHASS